MIADKTIFPLKRYLLPLCLITMALVISSCGGGSSDDQGPSTGVASLSVTDAPSDDVSLVQISVHRIDLKPASGNVIQYNFDEPLVVENLLDLQGPASQVLLPPSVLPAGNYDWVRLYIIGGWPDSYVTETDSGGIHDLFIPGQQEKSGDKKRFFQLVSGFSVPAGARADFTIDIDLRKALTKPSKKDYYLLRPALRIIDNRTTGTIRGDISATLLNDLSCTHDTASGAGVSVYLYEGHDAATGDIEVDDNGAAISTDSPLTADNANIKEASADYEYALGFIPSGDYTIALTCQARDDMPQTNDAISFLQVSNISVSANDTTVYDFID